MPITLEKFEEPGILIVHSQPGTGDTMQQMFDVVAEIIEALDAQTEKVFLVIELREIKMSLDDIIQGANLSARGQAPLLRHENIRETMYVLTDGLVRMAIKGLNSATFGQIKANVFDNVEAAVEYCRGKAGTLDF